VEPERGHRAGQVRVGMIEAGRGGLVKSNAFSMSFVFASREVRGGRSKIVSMNRSTDANSIVS
jgi:hypothetical protein